MKSKLLLLAAAIMMCGCEKPIVGEVLDDEVDEEEAEALTKKFTFTMKGDFTSATFKRAAGYLQADGRDMTDVWVLDYMNGELVQQIHQGDNTADDFGKPVMQLAYGSHHVYFVASRGTAPTLNVGEHSITWEKPSDTFWHCLTLTVAAGTPVIAQQVTLSRVATRLRITPTDKIPEGAAKLTCSPSVWYYGLDLLTGEAANERVQPREIAIPATYVGTAGELSASFFGLSSAEPWQTDVAVAVLDGDGSVMGSVTIEGVTMSRNVTTVYSGGIFGKGGTMAVTADDGWGADDVHEW